MATRTSTSLKRKATPTSPPAAVADTGTSFTVTQQWTRYQSDYLDMQSRDRLAAIIDNSIALRASVKAYYDTHYDKRFTARAKRDEMTRALRAIFTDNPTLRSQLLALASPNTLSLSASSSLLASSASSSSRRHRLPESRQPTSTPTIGIARTRTRRTPVPTSASVRGAESPTSGGREVGGRAKTRPTTKRDLAHAPTVEPKRIQGDEEKRSEEKEEQKVAVASPGERMELTKLTEEVGYEVLDFWVGPEQRELKDSSITKQLRDLRAIAEWQKEPIAVDNSLMSAYYELADSTSEARRRQSSMSEAQRRQWQQFVNTYLRRLTRHRLIELIDATDLVALVSQRFRTLNARDSLASAWRDAPAEELVNILLEAVETNVSRKKIRADILAQGPPIALPSYVTRKLVAPLPDSPLTLYLPIEIATRLEDKGVDTVAALRVLSIERRKALMDVGRLDTAKAPVNGELDHILRKLYELGVALTPREVWRYHAVYEWAIAKQDAKDTEIAIWRPWLQPGQRVNVRLHFSGPTDDQQPIARAWREHAGWSQGGRLTGTVLTYRDATTTSHASPPTSPQCVILLDADQFPWLTADRTKKARPTKLARTVTCVGDVKGGAQTVYEYMRKFSGKRETSVRFRRLKWTTIESRAEWIRREQLTGIAAPGSICVEAPRAMVDELMLSLAIRGERVLARCRTDFETYNTGTYLDHYSEARVLRGGTTEAGETYLQVWVDGYIIAFVLQWQDSDLSRNLCVIPSIASRTRFESRGIRLHIATSYRISLVGSLRAQVRRLETNMPPKIAAHNDLANLVTSMLL